MTNDALIKEVDAFVKAMPEEINEVHIVHPRDAERLKRLLINTRAALAPVDVEGLKREAFNHCAFDSMANNPNTWDTHQVMEGAKRMWDYLAARGCFGVPQWQPIETAPKPVGFEEIWVIGSDGIDVRTTRWCTEYPCTEGVWLLNYEPTDYINNINYWFPTHWMPLPAAPKKEGGDA